MRLFLLVWAVMACRAEQSRAEKLIKAGHWKQARAIVEARLREAPADALSYFLLSQIRGAFGDRATPLTLAERAIALDGSTAMYHRQVAEVLGVAAQHAGAFQQLLLARRFHKEIAAALALDPRDLQSLRDLLEFYLLAPGLIGGDLRKAIEVAGRIVEIDAAEGLTAQARIAEFRKQPAVREGLLRRAADVQPSRHKAVIALAQYYLESHSNASRAEAQAKAAIALDPGRVDGYAILAAIYADSGAWSDLDSILAIALRQVPDDPVPHYRAAERLMDAERDPARAERYLRVYLEQDPEGNRPSTSEARWKLGLALRAQGLGTKALAEFKESVRLDPESKASRELRLPRNARTAIPPAPARPM